MADDKKNIGPEAKKPGDAPPEKIAEPIKDTPPAPEQPAPGAPQTPVVETAPKAQPAPTVESKTEEKATPAPKVLDFSAAKNKAPTKEETAPEKKPVKEQAAEKPKRGRPAKADKAAPTEKPKQPRDKMSQNKKTPGKEAPVPPKPEAAPKEAKAPEQVQPAAPRDATRSAEPEQIVYINLSEMHPFKNHPFGVRDDSEMKELVESVKASGVNQPALVRPREDGGYTAAEVDAPDIAEEESTRRTLPADPEVKNFSYTVVDGEVFYRENSVMTQVELSDTAKGRVTGMVELRQIVNDLIQQQLEDYPDADIKATQERLNAAYDVFTAQYGLLNDRKNGRLFEQDSSYYLLCSLENLDEQGQLKSKAAMFTKRTIRPERTVTSVDTPSEALAVSIGERGKVDLPYMAELLGTPGEYGRITTELSGVIFKDPAADADDPEAGWQTADEYLSGNVRDKLRMAQLAAESHPEFKVNVDALTKAQPKDLEASEIDVRLGATWLAPSIVQQFMMETFQPPYRIRYNNAITVRYSPYTSEWRISNKSATGFGDIMATETYGTRRANAYKILEDTLNLRDSRVYDTIEEDGKEKRVLNQNETTLAQQKQQAIKDAFAGWVWKDPQRRALLVKKYNELFNSTRPREYDGSHIHFVGMNPEINLREHQRNAVAHVLYGYNTLLAHEVGAGKSFEMAASAMELKRLGLCQKSLFVVPNHLTEQWASEFLRLYPNAKLLVTSKKDFEPGNRKKFCERIATGDYDAVIIGHSQFEKIPLSAERQERLIQEQMDEIEEAIEEAKAQVSEHFTVKQLEKLRKSLKQKLEKLQGTDRKDDVVTFEQLGVDRLFVDESQAFKNLYLYTKMRNVAGLSTSEAQKSSDMFGKCRYLDEITGGRGVIFATGTPLSNSMTEMYTLMRYLQYNTLQQKGLTHFDAWASTFGETTTAIELAPEGYTLIGR